MGNCFGAPDIDDDDAPKQYSWDTRADINPDDYVFKDLDGQTLGKMPGSIEGQMFTLERLKNCKVYLFDHMSAVNVDDCEDCTIFIGPTNSSVFIRDCKNCKIVLACKQYRTRDCDNIECLLCCNTLPIIEASTNMKFGNFRGSYFQLPGQFSSAGMSLYNNNWWRIHDFTPASDGKNFSWLEDNPSWLANCIDDVIALKQAEFVASIPAEPADDLASVGYEVDGTAAVPLTLGPHPKKSEESCLVVVFKGHHAKKMLGAVQRAAELKPGTVINVAQTKEAKSMNADDANRVFAGEGNKQYADAAQAGELIGIEFNGDGAVAAARAAGETIRNGLVFVSADAEGGEGIVNSFFTYMDLQLKI